MLSDVRRKAAVTGAGGFIGQFLCQHLLQSGWQVLALGLHQPPKACSNWVRCDIRSVVSADHLRGIDTVFHLAGKAHALADLKSEEGEYDQLNIEGTRNVLEAAHLAGVRRFVFASSTKAMTRKDAGNGATSPFASTLPLTEEDAVEPDTAYGRSKLRAEELVLRGGVVSEPVVLRLCLVYGPGVKGNLRKMIKAVRDGRFPRLPETGNRRSMVHVADVVQAFMLAAQKPEACQQVFIVSDGTAYSTAEVHRMIGQALNQSLPRWRIPLWSLRAAAAGGDLLHGLTGRRPGFDSDALQKLLGSAWFSPDKILRLLGYEPEWNLEKALPAMVQDKLFTCSPVASTEPAAIES